MEELKRLLTVRKLIALFFAVVGCYLWATQKADLKDVFTVIVGFYFGNKTALDIPGKDS